MTTRELRNTLLAELALVIEPQGYKPNKAKATFTKRTAEGYHRFQLIFLTRSTGWEIDPVMLIRKNVVETLYHKASYFAPEFHHTTPTIGTTVANFINDGQDYRFRLTSEADLPHCRQGLLFLFEQTARPFFAQYDNLYALEQEVNREDQKSRFSGLKYEGTVGIILAKLVKNPRYDHLVVRYRSYYQRLADGFYLPEYEGVLQVLQGV